ncbi:MAG: tRNA (cytidine(56)-2'-O)-methyltransferase [Candidatus Heimdallarchaeota archaeon]|nr:MAG: tRNA (cytidine(56)-2'-O)-methyltransferase [Candidatus Heimdallarchaeota archaeon]
MVTILRIGHRIERDKRITTHLALVARSLGANRLVVAGDKDKNLEETIFNVVKEWGGTFQFEIIPYDNWKSFLSQWKSNERNKIAHLTMYGENLTIFEKSDDFLNLKRHPQNLSGLLVVVGGEKIPGKVFHCADWNIAITNQPHSEVGSLAVFLDHLIPNALQTKNSDAKKQIIPSLKGKKLFRK